LDPKDHKDHKDHRGLPVVKELRDLKAHKEYKDPKEYKGLPVPKAQQVLRELKVQLALKALPVVKDPLDHKVRRVQLDHRDLKVLHRL